jgi:hypothetical protein
MGEMQNTFGLDKMPVTKRDNYIFASPITPANQKVTRTRNEATGKL